VTVVAFKSIKLNPSFAISKTSTELKDDRGSFDSQQRYCRKAYLTIIYR